MSKIEILRTQDYLEHIVEAIDRIHRYVDDLTELGFLEDAATSKSITPPYRTCGLRLRG